MLEHTVTPLLCPFNAYIFGFDTSDIFHNKHVESSEPDINSVSFLPLFLIHFTVLTRAECFTYVFITLLELLYC